MILSHRLQTTIPNSGRLGKLQIQQIIHQKEKHFTLYLQNRYTPIEKSLTNQEQTRHNNKPMP